VFGWGVPIEQSVPYLLEKSLQSDFADKKIEVINAGLPAQWLFYNIFYYLLEGYKYNPDAVVVMQVHDLGFMAISDLMKLKRQIVPLSVEAVYQNMYRKIASTPLLRKSELLYFILEQTRRNEDIRKYVHITYVANPKKQTSALDEKKFFKRFSQAPEEFGNVLSNIVEFSQYVERLEPGEVQKYVFAGGDPTWNAVPDYDMKDNGGIIPQASDAITQVLSEFFTVLEGEGRKTLFFNVNGHAFFEGRKAEKDAYISAQTTASLKKFNINHLSYDEYLFDTMNYSYGDPEIRALFYPLDKHPNQQGYELLAELLHERIDGLQWVP